MRVYDDVMEKVVSNEELQFMKLTEDQFTSFGKIVYRSTELECAIAMLAIHMRMMKARDKTRFDSLYTRHYGRPGAIQLVRDGLAKQPPSVAVSINVLMDTCEELLGYRHAIAHGLPRKSALGVPYMWRQVNKTDVPENERHEALQVDVESLRAIETDLKDAFDRVVVLVHHFWPPVFGENPRPVQSVEIPGHEVTREDILRPPARFNDYFENATQSH